MSEPVDSYALIIKTDEATALILGEALADWNLGVHLPDGGDAASLEVFCANRAEAESCQHALAQLTPKAHFDMVTIKPVARQDWAESWKQYFHVQRVSERIVVKPSWEIFAARSTDCIVEIDPGLSFGTGLHGTTRACLKFLDQWQCHQPQASVIDIGCGTGILAIAAAKLGFSCVTAMDNDLNAVRVARSNAASNGVVDRITFIHADVLEFNFVRTYDLVLANLLAETLVTWADRIAAAVSQIAGGGLVLSGIMAEQYEAVRSVYAARGLEERESIVLDKWQTGCFLRK